MLLVINLSNNKIGRIWVMKQQYEKEPQIRPKIMSTSIVYLALFCNFFEKNAIFLIFFHFFQFFSIFLA